MSGRVSYFQRFSQPENHATNNTLLLLRYFAEVCPSQLQKIFEGWFDRQITIGLSFQQQGKMERSVPDGLIRQEPFSIYIEAKRDGALFDDQIERHIASIEATKPVGTMVLIGLTCEEPPQVDEARFVAAAHAKGIVYRGLTFSRILEDLRAACGPSCSEANLILDDFASYLEEEGLVNRRESRLAVFPSGTSYLENLQYGLCYEPAERPCRSATAYIGLYTNKKIIGVGKLVSTAVMKFENGKPAPRHVELGTVTGDQIAINGLHCCDGILSAWN